VPEISDIFAGNQLAGARMIRLIEDNDPNAFDMLKQLYPNAGKAFIIGITGAPGVGKSTLIDGLILKFCELDYKVGVIAVDPSSPVSGGAVLGDRFRMQRHAANKNVFIRSMASRGQKGGLSKTTKDAVIVLDAMGYDIIIIETVGAGQAEFDIADIVHSNAVVTIPGTGDSIQVIKAGILETGDIFVVNKCDRIDADICAAELKAMLSMKPKLNTLNTAWEKKVIKTDARSHKGLKELCSAFLEHLEHMKKSSCFDQKKEAIEKSYFHLLLKDLAEKRVETMLTLVKQSKAYKDIIKKIESHETDPFNAVELLEDKFSV